jgi:hypothetical protein
MLMDRSASIRHNGSEWWLRPLAGSTPGNAVDVPGVTLGET